ncbi:MAG: hypothetical protein MI757_03105 [Pirellulales bacterium]|nr:hypothetical protein [Pirellulales bacterium]
MVATLRRKRPGQPPATNEGGSPAPEKDQPPAPKKQTREEQKPTPEPVNEEEVAPEKAPGDITKKIDESPADQPVESLLEEIARRIEAFEAEMRLQTVDAISKAREQMKTDPAAAEQTLMPVYKKVTETPDLPPATRKELISQLRELLDGVNRRKDRAGSNP